MLCVRARSLPGATREVNETHGNLDGFILEDPTCLPQRAFSVLVSMLSCSGGER